MSHPLKRSYDNASHLIHKSELKPAIDEMLVLVRESGHDPIRMSYDHLVETYQYILKYSIEGVADPRHQEMMDHLKVSLLELADLALQKSLTRLGSNNVYRLKKRLELEVNTGRENTTAMLDELSFGPQLEALLDEAFIATTDTESAQDEHNEKLSHVFNYIWLSDKYQEDESALFSKLISSDNIPWFEKSLFISALTLSLMRCFDMRKFELLVSTSRDSSDHIRQRSLAGLIIGLYVHSDRLYLYPSVLKSASDIFGDDEIRQQSLNIILLMLRSRETEKISKKIKEEIIPEMIKLTPKITEKLDLDNILDEGHFDEHHPEWEQFLEDSPELMDKLQEFSEMQFDGADVFMTAFSMLKHFSFFSHFSHWFLPFYPENPILHDEMQPVEGNLDLDRFLKDISGAPFLCNSDKYSFCLNMRNLAPAQLALIREFFPAEMEQMSEMVSEEEKLNKGSHGMSISRSYIQDIYRFFKLHPDRSEFDDIFSSALGFHRSALVQAWPEPADLLQSIAGFHFSQKSYPEALDVYLGIIEMGITSYEIFEKTAYCYQKTGNFAKALVLYKKAELFDINALWLIKKIAICHRYLGQPAEALDYYKQALRHNPDDLQLKIAAGNCLLEMQEYQQALDHYYAVEFSNPDNLKVLRPIAWCLFVTGRLEEAVAYYERLIESEENPSDLLNLGHVELCRGQASRAIELYLKSISLRNNKLSDFINSFNDDIPFLLAGGVSAEKVHLVTDMLRFRFDGSYLL